MYRKNETQQLRFDEFKMSFGGKLNGNNRWVKLTKVIPWDELEAIYAKKMCEDNGRLAKSFRLVLGSLIIKAKLSTTDEETVEQIKENPYLQYFIGLAHFVDKCPFDASCMTHFRKRINFDETNAINDLIDKYNRKKGNDDKEKEAAVKNKGRLKIDASVSPQDIRYPTDTSLLNEAREKTEKIIDWLSMKLNIKKPRIYRRKARKDFLAFSKKRKHSKSSVRLAVRKQLQYVRRNINFIHYLSDKANKCLLNWKQLRTFWIIQELFRQQLEMYEKKTSRIDNRIVSLYQPHVRPIVRGKQKVAVEFGSKFSISEVEGITYVDRLQWEAYNEAGDLKKQVESYRTRFGYYPECVCADKIYWTRENRRYLKELGIRFTAKPIGRPETNDKITAWEKRKQRKLEREDFNARNAVEGKFGVAKRRYSLDLNMMKLPNTSEMWVSMLFLAMNLDTWLAKASYFLFYQLSRAFRWEKIEKLSKNDVDMDVFFPHESRMAVFQ